MNPEVKTLVQWQWTLIAESVSVVTVNNLSTNYKVWYTTRDTGDTAPTTFSPAAIPVEAVDMFPENGSEFVLESQTLVDVYAFMYSKDTRIALDGNLLIREGVGNSIDTDTIYGGINVNVQDQVTPPVIVALSEELGDTTLAVEAVLDAYTITVTDSTGITVGDHIRVVSDTYNRTLLAEVISLTGNVVTIDRPVDFTYPVGAIVIWANDNMAVDGSVTPVSFKLRLADTSIPATLDITRAIFLCECDSAVDLSSFGDISGGLINGIVLRHINGITYNIMNAKTNADFSMFAYDWTPYSASNPAQGVDGFSSRLTFAGQNKIGVAIRVEQDGQLEMLVQDDLSSLVLLKCIVEGHIVS